MTDCCRVGFAILHLLSGERNDIHNLEVKDHGI